MLLSAFCLVAATTGCSDDDKGDGNDDAKESPGVPSLDPKAQKKKIAKIVKCTAQVSTTGAYEADWSGDATVRTGGREIGAAGPLAVYTLTDKKNRVALYSPGPEFNGSISLTVARESYSSDPADAESFDIDERGKRAKVDAALTSISGDEIQLAAEFTCGKTEQ
jgi:hypothetical protein